MLILSRRPGDAILIDGGIRIVVLACDAKGVRLGIEAPSNVGIVREEIVVQIADENRRANTASAASAWLDAIPPLPSGHPASSASNPTDTTKAAESEPTAGGSDVAEGRGAEGAAGAGDGIVSAPLTDD